MSEKSSATIEAYVDRRTAAEILGVGAHVVNRLAREGKIRTRNLPVRSKYLRKDVDHLVETCSAAGAIN